MTKGELHKIDLEIDQLNEEADWRDPNLEWRWFEWADSRLSYLIQQLEDSYKKAKIEELGLKLFQGVAV